MTKKKTTAPGDAEAAETLAQQHAEAAEAERQQSRAAAWAARGDWLTAMAPMQAEWDERAEWLAQVAQAEARQRGDAGEADRLDADAEVRRLKRGEPFPRVSSKPAEGAAKPIARRGVPSNAIALCFAGLKWNQSGWKSNLSKVSTGWLHECMVAAGVQGNTPDRQRRWNPVMIGTKLVAKFEVMPNSVRARFQVNAALHPWFEDWKDHEAAHCETE